MSVLEYGYTSLNKKGEELCGDKVEVIRGKGGGITLVLADGLGSGVKANILSTLTSKILCTMIAAGVPLNACIDTIVSSLPVCKTRGVAYATFTIVQLNEDGTGSVAEFDNPPAILIKNGKVTPLAREERLYRGKKIYLSQLDMNKGDMLMAFSDGVVHAGVGELLNFGWDIAEIREYTQAQYNDKLSARTMASLLASACYGLYGQKPGDDTTVLAVKYRPRTHLNIMIGPPVNKEQDSALVSEFMAGADKRAVCGGTSSQVVARELGQEVLTSFDYPDPEVPPIGYIKGVDLTTEGVLTLKKMLMYADTYLSTTDPNPKLFSGEDGASQLANLLLIDASDVRIFVGRNVNLAHEGLGIDNKTKLDYVVRLVSVLKSLGKNVEIKYY